MRELAGTERGGGREMFDSESTSQIGFHDFQHQTDLRRRKRSCAGIAASIRLQVSSQQHRRLDNVSGRLVGILKNSSAGRLQQMNDTARSRSAGNPDGRYGGVGCPLWTL
jgi:hypothetical protein